MRLLLLLSLIVYLPLVSGEQTTINLAGEWHFQPGDDPSWAQPNFPDQNWLKQNVPGTWQPTDASNMAWYRRQIALEDLSNEDLGIQIGAVRNAYELYVEGTWLGGVGRLPPNAEVNYDELQVYRIPSALTANKDSITIALRVWGGSDLAIAVTGAGPYGGDFKIGSHTRLIRQLDADQIPKLIFASLFLLAGSYFLYLQIRTHSIPAFLWFGSTALVLSVYILTQSQWKYRFDLSFLTFEKIEAMSFLLFLVTLTQLIWAMIEQPVPKIMRAIQVTLSLFAVAYLFAPDLSVHYVLRPFWQSLVVVSLAPVLWVILRQTRAGNADARLILAGIALFALCGVHDLVVNISLISDSGTRLMPLGFLAILVAMGVSLAGKFKIMLTSLEQQVEERTRELSQVNQQLAAANNSLVEMTRIDPLTGILNRRGLTSEAEIERQRFIRSREPFAMVIADIDHFKQFNDRYGHAGGDKVLVAVAEIFRESVRDVDKVARWGGEEFVLLFPGTDISGLENIAEKLRQRIEHFELEFEGRLLKITMTFGGAVYDASETIDECLARADTALYQGKEAGRNRVMINEAVAT